MSLAPQVPPPDFSLSEHPVSQVEGARVVALAVLPATDGPDGPESGPESGVGVQVGPGGTELDEALDGPDLLDVLEAAGASGEAGEVTELPGARRGDAAADQSPLRVLLVGVGDATPGDLRRAGAALARRVRDVEEVASSVAAVGDLDGLTAFVEGATLGSFTFSLRQDGPETRPVAHVVLAGSPADAEATEVLARAVARSRAAWRARLLASVPSNTKNPAWLADQAVTAAEAAGLSATVLDDEELRRQGFGGIVGVGQASATPPRFVRLDYRPQGRGARKAPHVVLVGKGITFDSGGLSIKPGAAMVSMKRDMTGAAVVASVMAALPAVGCPVRVTGLLPLAENAVGGRAMRPGDVLTHFGGRTTEVTNTDAEGRLVLGDALAYAVQELDADALVDIATLTGGVKVALGQHLGGLFATDDALAGALAAAGARSGEPLWRLPLSQEYAGKLSSKIADADNAPGGPPAITAALFLQPFTGGKPWAHLDIASVGDAPKESFEYTEGPTGFGVRLLLDWLAGEEPLAGVGG
ncbi:leucyl aminopeptidase [Nocardioides scoriae]|uniref:Probable cytosol aminopeptidase n=1 Tax=Nocardioides scoriae TaxID=642780 RepID=A0A1H1XEA3_9ACTN|nr:leucyl aminopeptidase family protein [Nocardioides scoriae]SDT07009.1 leucyl aminopeptidase [Nocardioides scoriae]